MAPCGGNKMPKKPSGNVIINHDWELQTVETGCRRRGVTAASDSFIQRLAVPGRVEVQQNVQVSARGRRTAEALPPMDITLPADPTAAYVLALRHPSGALTSHRPSEPVARRRGAAAGT